MNSCIKGLNSSSFIIYTSNVRIVAGSRSGIKGRVWRKIKRRRRSSRNSKMYSVQTINVGRAKTFLSSWL